VIAKPMIQLMHHLDIEMNAWCAALNEHAQVVMHVRLGHMLRLSACDDMCSTCAAHRIVD